MASTEVERIRRLIDGLRRGNRTHPYRGRREYSELVREVAATCHELISIEPGAVPALLARAVERVTAALMHMDDSSGVIGDDLRGLMAIHAHACTVARPDTKRLAAWLVKLRLDGPGWPDFELRDYADALGERGRAEIARLVTARAATAASDPHGWDGWGIRCLREQLAEISGDVDQYVAVLAETLHSATQYLRIVDTLTAAGRQADAEQWARRGLDQRGVPDDVVKLRDMYVELLLRRGAGADAVALRQNVFDRNPTRAHYAELHRTATAVGCWDRLRDTMIEYLRETTVRQPGYADELIGVLLDEDEHDQAWQVGLDYADSLHESRWLQLIDLHRTTHPSEVIVPLQRLIERRLATDQDKYRYDKAIKLLRQLRSAYQAAGNPAGFSLYTEELRTCHKRKTSLIAKLDHATL